MNKNIKNFVFGDKEFKTSEEVFNYMVKQVSESFKPENFVIESIINNIRKITKEYIEKNNIEKLIVGVSGGLDSAVVCALLQEKYTGIPLIGVSIPMSSSNAHKEQAKWVGENFCSVFKEFEGWDKKDIETNETLYEKIFQVLEQTNSIAEESGCKIDSFPKNVLQGNMKARIRMITLYDLARKSNGMVLSTDNLSELLAGFWTICGDVGDYGVIQNIWKGLELPYIAKALNVREDIISQPPSDGLMVTEDNTDEAQLGSSYIEFDTIISIYTNEISKKINEKECFQLQEMLNSFPIDSKEFTKMEKAITRYKNTQFKRNGTINLSREEIGI